MRRVIGLIRIDDHLFSEFTCHLFCKHIELKAEVRISESATEDLMNEAIGWRKFLLLFAGTRMDFAGDNRKKYQERKQTYLAYSGQKIRMVR